MKLNTLQKIRQFISDYRYYRNAGYSHTMAWRHELNTIH